MNSHWPARTSRARWIPVASGLIYAVLILLACLFVDLQRVHVWAERLNGGLVLILLSLLPLFGVPVSVLYFVVGARFGTVPGLAAAAFAIALHLLGIHFISASFLRTLIRDLLRRTRYRLPALVPNRGRIALAMLTALLPGPYSVKNYLLAIAGLPLRPFLIGCWPVYFVQASSGILFGDLSGALTPTRMILFAIYAVLIALLGRYVLTVWRKEEAQRAQLTPGAASGVALALVSVFLVSA